LACQEVQDVSGCVEEILGIILQAATMKLFSLQTSGEVEEYLLSLGDDATKN
jgi:hypothetical protein